MKTKYLLISCSMLFLAYACNNSETKKTTEDSTKAMAPEIR